jgi:hypothetical protein
MDLIIWLGIAVLFFFTVWAAAPYHQRLIASREIPLDKGWD